MTKFKIGDKVRRKAHEGENNGFKAGDVGTVVKERDGNVDVKIKGKKDISHANWHTCIEVIPGTKNLKLPSHVVIWDEEDRDPHKFFESEPEAKGFIKELSENSDVKKESILLVEIKSARKVNIVKNLKYTQHKI